MLPSVPKKKRKNEAASSSLPVNDIISTKTTYRTPKYLKIFPNLLFQILRIQLKHGLKKAKERKYIHDRLQLFDRQYRLQCHRNLWQSYFTLGSEHQLWPNQVTKMTKTNEHGLCQQFVINHLTKLNQQYDQCTNELITQSSNSCPSTLLSLQNLDENLKDFVEIQEKYIANKMHAQLTRYKNTIQEKVLFQTVSTMNLTIDQKNIVAQLDQLQQIQMNNYEELLKLEIHVAIDYLPKQFHHLEKFIDSDHLNLSFKKNHLTTEFKQQGYKTIQEVKRTWLNFYLHFYELQIQEIDFQYQQNLSRLKQSLLKNTSVHGMTFYDSFITYMNHRQTRIEQEIYYEKIPIYRKKLLRIHRRHLKSIKKLVSVLPKVILDIPFNSFTARQLAYLSRGSTYIRSNQSVLRPYNQRMKNIKTEHNNIMNKLKNYMANLEDRLQAYLTHRYMASIPFIDILVLRKTDKSGVLHIGQAIDYRRKAMEYRQKTCAYEELSTNPLNDTFYKVIQLLNKLLTAKDIKKTLEILAEFLREHHCEKINGISIQTIIELARLVLQENVFVYKNKFYRQIIGGAMGSAFTLTLANIFMWKWQKETILSKIPSHKCYGRWNGSEEAVKEILEAANGFHPNIKLTYTISKTISFLDLLRINDHGILLSSVYHKSAAEPTVLSFLSDHPRHVFRNIIQTALMRAI
ncbi:unnamed protein product [Rotaria sordida]|uniref:Uncharacterized protein n=1 Tax=Rotaria sordida TaxID=392033 RepID=A0A814ZBS6_9BILA|nr:unnamed protein product [Rotaria sordida]